MADDFDEWVVSLRFLDAEDPDDGELPKGTSDFLREIFDTRGPVSATEVERAWDEREEDLAHQAVQLFLTDLHGSTRLRPKIEIWRHENGAVVVAYNGNYTTPVILSMRVPEVVREAADNLRDHVVDDLCGPWPICPVDGFVVDPDVVEGAAVWHCRRANHVISAIGDLPSTGAGG